MRIKLSSVFVEDQTKALDFYTRVLGFEKKTDIPMGEARWLTVVSPEDPDGCELLLEPATNPVAARYQEGLYEQGIPITSFEVADARAEYERLKAHGVVFRSEPTEGPTVIATFEDTCGNLVQMHQV